MRTTLTLDPDVAERVRQETAGGKRSLKVVVNDALRRGLSGAPPPRKRFRAKPHSSPYQPGIDRTKLGQFIDELDGEAFLAGQKRSRKRK